MLFENVIKDKRKDFLIIWWNRFCMYDNKVYVREVFF